MKQSFILALQLFEKIAQIVMGFGRAGIRTKRFFKFGDGFVCSADGGQTDREIRARLRIVRPNLERCLVGVEWRARSRLWRESSYPDCIGLPPGRV